jgi:hypothetical protein
MLHVLEHLAADKAYEKYIEKPYEKYIDEPLIEYVEAPSHFAYKYLFETYNDFVNINAPLYEQLL